MTTTDHLTTLLSGINDVSWNNPRGFTPHLGKLAQESGGIILDNAYSLPVCTPSRTALLTGVYPFKLGLQRGFGKHTPEGIPLNTTLLPQYMKDLGYTTHGLGKWHLGFCSQSYTPLRRGFDTYHGNLGTVKREVFCIISFFLLFRTLRGGR